MAHGASGHLKIMGQNAISRFLVPGAGRVALASVLVAVVAANAQSLPAQTLPVQAPPVQALPGTFETVDITSANPEGTLIKGYLSRAPQAAHQAAGNTAGKEPVVVALHGCGGNWNSRGGLEKRYRDYQTWFQERGISLLLLDSFTTRGKPRGICTEPNAFRSIRPADRRLDVQGAVRWLQQQAWADTSRLLLLGWSHGGSTVLSSMDGAGSPATAFKAAVAFYPGCTSASQNSNYHLERPLLLMIGLEDDWTPARPCQRFHDLQSAKLSARGLDAGRFQLKLYPGAHHGFDGTAPVRRRPDVPNGVQRGAGVTSGGHGPSREDALRTLDNFLTQFF